MLDENRWFCVWCLHLLNSVCLDMIALYFLVMHSPMRGGIKRVRAHAEVSHGPPHRDLPTSATAHQTLLSQLSSILVPFPVSRRTWDLPLASFAVTSAGQWWNFPAYVLLINYTQIWQTAITVELFGSLVSHFFPRTLPWELLCTFIWPCGGVSLITINKDRPGKTRTATDSSKFT